MSTTTAQTSPRPPSLAETFESMGKMGLRAVFAAYDQRVRSWSEQAEMARLSMGNPMPLSTGPLLSPNARARSSSGAGFLPNAGWALYDYEVRIGDASSVRRPQSTIVSIQPIEWRDSWIRSGGLAPAWVGSSTFNWVEYQKATGVVAPRTFLVSFNEMPTTEGYRTSRLLCRVTMMPGNEIRIGTQVFTPIREAVRTVTKRIGAGQYVAWLESAEPDDPTPNEELHVAAIFAEAV